MSDTPTCPESRCSKLVDNEPVSPPLVKLKTGNWHCPNCWRNYGDKICYECEQPCFYLFDDGRCKSCTRMTPEEVRGD